MGVTFWVDYERLGHGYCCDKGAAFTLGSLDSPFIKPDTKPGLAVFMLIIVLIYSTLNLTSPLLICRGEVESYHNNADW